jgi:hypothetical protein
VKINRSYLVAGENSRESLSDGLGALAGLQIDRADQNRRTVASFVLDRIGALFVLRPLAARSRASRSRSATSSFSLATCGLARGFCRQHQARLICPQLRIQLPDEQNARCTERMIRFAALREIVFWISVVTSQELT